MFNIKKKKDNLFKIPLLQSLSFVALAATLSACGGTSNSDSNISPPAMSIDAPASAALGALSPEAVPHLKIKGTELVDHKGRAQVLRGWNWGRWGTMQANDASDHIQEGANTVRIPLRWWGYYSGTGNDSRDPKQTQNAGIDQAHLDILDEMMAKASEKKLWIVLFIDSDCGQNGTQSPEDISYCDPQKQYLNKGGHNFWSDKNMRKDFIEVWKFIAKRYKDKPYLAMFEPLPEPNPQNATDDEIRLFYDEVMKEIRTVAPNIPFVVGPRSYYMKTVDNAFNPNWKDVVYTGNLFVYTDIGTSKEVIANLDTRLSALQTLRSNQAVPVFIQQAGVESGKDLDFVYLNALMSKMNQAQIGYTYWTYRDTFNPDAYGAKYQKSDGTWKTKQTTLDTISSYFKQ